MTNLASNTKPKKEDILPWHKQFWPWFLIILPGVVISSCIGMVFLAFYKADQLVDKDYYKSGLAINEVKHDIEQARALGVGIQLHLSKTEKLWRFDAIYSAAQQENPPYLLVSLEHPLEESLDQTLLLKPNGDTYTAFFDLTKKIDSGDVFHFDGNQFWYIDIQPANSHALAMPLWRLKSKFYSTDTDFTLGTP